MGSTRIYFTGSHSTGKTTLARWAAERYSLPLVTEVVRKLLAAKETSLDAVRLNVAASNDLQLRSFEGQIAAEREMGVFVSDRCIDCLAYTARWATNAAEIAATPDLLDYVDSLRRSVVFFVRPHRELVVADGTRAAADLAWDEVIRIDAMVELLLELYGIPYFSITPLGMRDRTAFIERIVGRESSLEVGRHG